MGDAADLEGDTPLGRMFGLSPEETEALETLCKDALAAQGVDGGAFFDRVRGGEALDAALGFPPGLRELIYSRAHRWFAIGRPDRAEGLFRALCAADPGDGDYWVGLGVCLRLRDDLDAARLSFETAGRVRPGWAVPEFHGCELALRRNDLDEASRRLDGFRRFSDEATPSEMATEADRLAHAIASRLSLAAEGGPQ